MFKPNTFLTLAIGVALSIFAWYYYSYVYNKNPSTFRGYDIENGDFFGINSQGKAYNIKANSIKKIGENIYKLNKLYAKYHMDQENDKYTEAVSNTGIFNRSKDVLFLNGNVEFILSEGYRMLTDNFSIDTKKHIATTKDEVLISGVQGKIMSKNGMIVYMKKKKIIFYGPVQSMFVENELKN